MNGQGVIGCDCAWCARPAVREIMVQPAQYRTVLRVDPVSGERVRHQLLVQAAITAAACDDHKTITTGQPQPVGLPRQRTARGIEQLGLFTTPDEARQRNAIIGEPGR